MSSRASSPLHPAISTILHREACRLSRSLCNMFWTFPAGCPCILGWSDLALCFRFLKTYTFLLIRYIFRSSIPKNQQISAARPRARTSHVRQSFHFQKIAVALNMNIFFAKICRILPYTSENIRQKENLKLNKCETFLLRNPKWANWF